jgi:predicted glutamine amidotransferase
MCELLGLSFNVPVNCRVVFRHFQLRGEANPHGWGFSYYSERKAIIIKEAVKITESALAEKIANDQSIFSKNYIIHVRKISKGKIGLENTHPFHFKIGGHDYVYAHNGTLVGKKRRLDTGIYMPLGTTDSEHAFYHLLYRISIRGVIDWGNEDFKWFAGLLNSINQLGKFNCLISDGENLFCYYDQIKHNGLHYLEWSPTSNLVQPLNGFTSEKPTGYIIATKPLSHENWKEFPPGKLWVFNAGRIIFQEP